MMLRHDFNHDALDKRSCPTLIDLAAYAEDRLGEDEKNRVEAHVAGCASCFDLVDGLRAEVADVDGESRVLLVPSRVILAATNLRPKDGIRHARSPAHIRNGPSWFVYARRGVALAACAGLAFAGYRIGASFTPSVDAGPVVGAPVANDGYAFGLLDADSGFGEGDLFAMAFAESMTKEPTP